MTSENIRLRIGWKVSSLALGMASVRYRALLPMMALRSVGVESSIFVSGLDSNLDGLDALVIVKSFSSDDLYLAQRAHERGIRVVFDLCDNIFIEEYAGKKGVMSPIQMLDVIAGHLDCMVVTTEPLADIVRSRFPQLMVSVIADGIETPRTTQDGAALLREAAAVERGRRLRLYGHKIVNVLRQIRQGGPAAVVPWTAFVAGRVLKKAKTWIRRRRAGRPNAAPANQQQKAVAVLPAQHRIVWFGNHGAPHARFGMLDLLEIRPALEAIAREADVELVVISNNREKYEANIRPFAIPSRYVEWAPDVVERWLKGASAVVVPNTLDPFSICKSANRTILALSCGVPVVATATPALEPLSAWIHTGDTLEGLLRVIREPEAESALAQEGFRQAQLAYGVEALARNWHALFSQLHSRQAGPVVAVDQPHTVVVLYLIQDLDLAVPILDAAEKAGLKTEVWCGTSLVRKSPRVLATLRSRNWQFKVLPDDGLAALPTFPATTRTVLTVAETNLGPHRFARRITETARSSGIFVATLQHGYENVGLTYDDAIHPIKNVNIAADRIYIWGPLETLHPGVDSDVRRRCVPAGCPKPAFIPAADLSDLIAQDRPVVGIFENLHWHRYSDAYRQAFLRGVMKLADEFPHVCFLVKPHHAGLWLTTRFEGEQPDAGNLIIADPQLAMWENLTAGSLLGRMSAVITSPSTVALDAARRGMPVAVFAGDIELPNYAPLPLLVSGDDWSNFMGCIADAETRKALEAASSAFVARVLTPVDAAGRIVGELAAMGAS